MASNVELSSMSQVLYDRLKCYCCHLHASAGKYRWYKCSKCSRYTCTSCKEEIDESCCGRLLPKYCELTEALLKDKTMQFKCINTSRGGCQETGGDKAMIAHEIECIYRPITCPCCFQQQTDEMPFHELVEHIDKSEYNVKVSCEDSNLVKVKCYIETLTINGSIDDATDGLHIETHKIAFKDGVFILNGERYPSESTFYFWIQMVGTTIEAKKYFYTVEFHGLNPDVRTTYSGQVLSVDERPFAIKEAKKFFGIDYGMFRTQFINEDRTFEVTISVKNMKEELKDDNEESGISDNE